MMSEWWTYDLSDLILFSSQTYYRLIEIYNSAIWPLQLVAILACIALLYLFRRPFKKFDKATVMIVTASWLWVAWAFHWQRFANIHWVASHYAFFFVVQAALFAWAGIFQNALHLPTYNKIQRRTGQSLVIFAFFIQPFLTILAGQNWKQIELFGISPEPTVVASIGLLLVYYDRKFWWLFIIPVLWCIVSAATFWVLGSVNTYVMCIVAIIAVFFIIWPHNRGSQLSEN